METQTRKSERRQVEREHSRAQRILKKEDWRKAALIYDLYWIMLHILSCKLELCQKPRRHYEAKTWPGESQCMCCSSNKIQLPISAAPPFLKRLLTQDAADAKHFRKYIAKYNAAFRVTSFGVNKLKDQNEHSDGFFITFKIQGQCYHRIEGLLPNEEHQFLQVYFMGTSEEEAQQRCTNIGGDSKLKVLTNLQKILYDHRKYVSVFKSALERLQNNTDMKIVIRPDKKPTMEHQGRFNPQMADEVAVLMVNEEYGKKDTICRSAENSSDLQSL